MKSKWNTENNANKNFKERWVPSKLICKFYATQITISVNFSMEPYKMMQEYISWKWSWKAESLGIAKKVMNTV